MKISMKGPKKWNWPSYATFGYLFEGIKLRIQYFQTHESWGTIHNSWVTEPVLVPVNRGMAAENVESIKRECLFIHTEKWIHAVARQRVELKITILNERGWTQINRNSMFSRMGDLEEGKTHKSRTIRGHEDDQREVRGMRGEHN